MSNERKFVSFYDLEDLLLGQLAELVEASKDCASARELAPINQAICTSIQTLILMMKQTPQFCEHHLTENKNHPKLPPTVDIKATVDGTEIFCDGKRVDGVASFILEHDPMKEPGAILTLRLKNCNFGVSDHAIPLLPAPWNGFYEPKHKGLTDIEHLKAERAAKEQSKT